MSHLRASAASAGVGATLAAIAIFARGGNEIGRMARIEVAVVLAAGVLLAATVLWGRGPRPLYGWATVACFAAFTAVTALSMSWSIAPDDTLEEAARSFAYLGLFAAAVASARLAPRAGPVVLRGVLLGALAVSAYALASRIWPGAFDETLGARLGEPYGYWNALGATAALAVVPALWLGTRETGRPLTRALSLPALGLLTLTILLTQSRGALVAAAVATILWVVLVPVRLRSLAIVALATAATAPVAAWALSKDAFTTALQPLSEKEAVATEFGLLVLLMLALLLAAGLAAERSGPARVPSLPARRRIGVAAVALACALPLVVLTSAAMSERGLPGTITDRVEELTDDRVVPPEGAARLGSVSSSRAGYWRQAGDIFEEDPLFGTGAGTFGIARLPYRTDQTVSEHAHGFFAQTVADMGLLGLAAALALLTAWLAAAARATGVARRRGERPRPGWSAERTALCALALCVFAFGIQSAVDWTWFVPGPSAMALVAAGFVAGRGPLPAIGARLPSRPSRSAPGPGSAVAAGLVLVLAGLCGWAVWQPEVSARASERALERLSAGDPAGAAREAVRARERNPYSPDPLYARAAVFAAIGEERAAYRSLERAVIEHPRDPDTWLRLARFELGELDLPERAIESAKGAFRLDPFSPRAVEITRRANEELGIPADGTAQPRARAGD